MATTQAELDTLCYEILREEQNTSAYPETLMHSLQNYAQTAVCAGNIEDPVTKQQIQKGSLPFLLKDQFYTSVLDTYLSADAVAGAASITVSDTSDFASSGYLWINGNIIQYASTTATTFAGISASTYPISFAHTSGTRVSQLFALPSDFGQSMSVTYDGRTQIFPQAYETLYKDLNNNKGQARGGLSYYSSIYNDFTNTLATTNPFYCLINGSFFLPFLTDTSGKSIRLQYNKVPPTITASVDATIPDLYAETIIPNIAVAEMLYDRGEEDRASRLLNRACGKIRQMYGFYDQLNSEDVSGNRVRTGKDHFMNI